MTTMLALRMISAKMEDAQEQHFRVRVASHAMEMDAR